MGRKNKADGRIYGQSEKYEDSPAQVKRRELRNKARAKLAKQGKVKKGDGKDVDHKQGIGKGNASSNLRAITEHNNRSYKRKSNHKQNFKDRK